LYSKGLKNKEENTIKECNCTESDLTTVINVVEEVVAFTGKEKDKVIPILQEVQKRLNYIPSEALKHICKITEITPGQISGVSTFYSQFRHIPAGRHIIKICQGTACHVKGANLVSDAFRRELKLEPDSGNTSDMLFSVEEVACLGCCTLAPVVQIDDKTYGHVSPAGVDMVIADFLHQVSSRKKSTELKNQSSVASEIRIGLGSCCVCRRQQGDPLRDY